MDILMASVIGVSVSIVVELCRTDERCANAIVEMDMDAGRQSVPLHLRTRCRSEPRT